MTKKRFSHKDKSLYIDDDYFCELEDGNEITELLNRQQYTVKIVSKENEQLKRVIAENEKLIQSTYDELTKLRCIKKNLGRIKAQWDWIMEAIQYD